MSGIEIIINFAFDMRSIYRTHNLLAIVLLLCFLFFLQSSRQSKAPTLEFAFNLNTKVVLSHITHTCSASDVQTAEKDNAGRESLFALQEDKFISSGNDSYYREREYESSGNNVKELSLRGYYGKYGTKIHKSLHQIGVLLI